MLLYILRVYSRRRSASHNARENYPSQPMFAIHEHRAQRPALQERLQHAHPLYYAAAPRSVARRAQRVRRCDPCTRTPHRPRTRKPSSPLRCFPPWCLLAFREHTCVSLCLMAVIFPRAFPQSRAAADQYASLLSTPARFTATRLPNPEAPSWAASHERSACDSPFALSFGPHTPHAIPLILPACCGLLHACVETLQATFELAAALGPTYLHAAEYTRCQASLFFSLLFAG